MENDTSLIENMSLLFLKPNKLNVKILSSQDIITVSKREKLIDRIKKSSKDLISTSKFKCKETSCTIDYLYNKELVKEIKTDSFENYYTELNTIGEGTSSVVKKCESIKTKEKYAVKIIRSLDPEKIEIAKSEFNKLISFNSELIIKAYELFINRKNNRIYLILEYSKDLIKLSTIIKNFGHIGENFVRKSFSNLVNGIFEMHKNGLVHRDLKPENILVNINGEKLKIIDFNVSKKVNITFDTESKENISMLTNLGTLNFTAPEALQGFNEYTEQVDMWAAGCILYYMLSGILPFYSDA